MSSKHRTGRTGDEVDRAGVDANSGIRVDVVKRRRHQQVAAAVAIEVSDRAETEPERRQLLATRLRGDPQERVRPAGERVDAADRRGCTERHHADRQVGNSVAVDIAQRGDRDAEADEIVGRDDGVDQPTGFAGEHECASI